MSPKSLVISTCNSHTFSFCFIWLSHSCFILQGGRVPNIINCSTFKAKNLWEKKSFKIRGVFKKNHRKCLESDLITPFLQVDICKFYLNSRYRLAFYRRHRREFLHTCLYVLEKEMPSETKKISLQVFTTSHDVKKSGERKF